MVYGNLMYFITMLYFESTYELTRLNVPAVLWGLHTSQRIPLYGALYFVAGKCWDLKQKKSRSAKPNPFYVKINGLLYQFH